MREWGHKTVLVLTMLLGWPAAWGQVEVGENLKLSLGGDLSVGYNGTFGSSSDISGHGLDFGGDAHLHGFYYNPQFVSFDLMPYYHRGQDNSAFQTITNNSGLTASANIFSGSRFPGSVSYARTWDGSSQYGIPGIDGIISHGNSSGFAITWSALLPEWPTLTASFSKSGGSSSIFGSNTESSSDSKTFTLQSTYMIKGFRLMGQYMRQSLDASFPAFELAGQPQESNNNTNTFNVSAGHRAPLHGYWNIGYNHSSYDAQYQSGASTSINNGSTGFFTTGLSMSPTQKLSVAFGADYNDNMYGSLQQAILNLGGVPLPQFNYSASEFSVNGQASYMVFSRMSVTARVTHYREFLDTGERGLTQFSGNATFNYAHRFLGSLTFMAGVVDTATEQGNSGTSFVGNVNFLRTLHRWEISGNFGYMQQVQTLYDLYTTSTMSYGASAKRRVGSLYWMTGFTGSHSGLSQYSGYSSRNESFFTMLRYRRYNVNAQYSESYGTSILTPTGLVPVPGIPPPLLPSPILYNAKSYGGGVGFTPFRRAQVSASYGKANSDTTGLALAQAFQSTLVNARLEYRLRKLNIEGNFTRFQQSIQRGVVPAEVNSYYVRISRWFNVF